MHMRMIVTLLILLSLATLPIVADEPTLKQTHVVIYDVSDIVRDPTLEKAQEERRARDIIHIIQDTIDPDHWQAKGGSVGAICELNGSLIVRTTDTNHVSVKSFLRQLREQRGLMIHVEARYLLMDERFLEDVGIGVGDPACFLDDFQTKFLIRASQGNKRAVTLLGIRTTFFNHQTVSVSVDEGVHQFEAILPCGGVLPVSDEEKMRRATLIVQGSITQDGKQVALRFRDRFIVPATNDQEPPALGDAISIPDRGTLMIDCGPYSEKGEEAKPARRLLLLLKPTLVRASNTPNPVLPAPVEE